MAWDKPQGHRQLGNSQLEGKGKERKQAESAEQTLGSNLLK